MRSSGGNQRHPEWSTWLGALILAAAAIGWGSPVMAQTPCAVDADCADGDPCTADHCRPLYGCVNRCEPRLDDSCYVTIGDTMWNDEGDGLQEPNHGVKGVQLEILSCEGGAPTRVVGGVTTDHNGAYRFRLPTCTDESLAVRVRTQNFHPYGVLPGHTFTRQDAGSDDTIDSDCDPLTGETACVDIARGTGDATVDCGFTPVVCRSPGFWGTHGGDEKGGPNVTQAAIDAAGGFLTVCGQTVDRSIPVGTLDSALEGLCMSAEGVHQRQLYRQLLAAALNCSLSGVDDCSQLVPGFAECDAACAGGIENAEPGGLEQCGRSLGCFNNGGVIDPAGRCVLGYCSREHHKGCGGEVGECRFIDVNGDGQNDNRCLDLPGNCHDRDLCDSPVDSLCFDSTGPASSPGACNDARKNDCTIDSCP